MSYDELLAAALELSPQDKLRLIKDLDQQEVGRRLQKLLSSLRTDALTEEDILAEVEYAREKRYQQPKASA
ncbi:MAG: hypothetical protein AAFQ98_00205 [Bacteroidota bacterium]